MRFKLCQHGDPSCKQGPNANKPTVFLPNLEVIISLLVLLLII